MNHGYFQRWYYCTYHFVDKPDRYDKQKQNVCLNDWGEATYIAIYISEYWSHWLLLGHRVFSPFYNMISNSAIGKGGVVQMAPLVAKSLAVTSFILKLYLRPESLKQGPKAELPNNEQYGKKQPVRHIHETQHHCRMDNDISHNTQAKIMTSPKLWN